MAAAAVASSVFAYFLFFVLLGKKAADGSRVQRRIKRLQSGANDDSSEELGRPLTERLLRPIVAGILRIAGRLPRGQRPETLAKTEMELRLAGIRMEAGDFSALRTVVLLLFIGFGLLLAAALPGGSMLKFLLVPWAAAFGAFLPGAVIRARMKNRREEMKRQMPDIMDLLSVSVEAGLSFDAALMRVGKYAKGALVDELTAVCGEIRMGRPRREALQDFGDRCGLEEIRSFTGALIQAEQLGVPIRNVLEVQAQQLRRRRRQAAEEKGMKAPVKMLLPLVLFIFPVIFLILLGPAVMKIIGIFGGMG